MAGAVLAAGLAESARGASPAGSEATGAGTSQPGLYEGVIGADPANSFMICVFVKPT